MITLGSKLDLGILMSGTLGRLLYPPVFPDENLTFSSRLLNVILLTTIPLTIANILYSYFINENGLIGVGIIIAALVMEIFILVVMRMGHVIAAAFLFSFLSLLMVNYVVHDTEGILNPVFAAHFLIILVAGLLIGGWTAVLMAGLSIASGVWLANRAAQGFLPLQYGEVSAWQALMSYGSIFIITAVALAIVRHSIEQYLIRSRRDLEERIRAEKSLQLSEMGYRELFISNPHPMWVFDVGTMVFLAVNNAAINHYGYAQDEFLHMTIKDIHPVGDIAALTQTVQNRTDLYGKNEIWRHHKKDGTAIDVEISAHPLNFEGKKARLVLAYDITERKQIEDNLRESESRFRLALSTSPLVICCQDRDLRYTWVYNSTRGIDTNFFIGKHDAEILSPEDEAPLTAVKKQVLATGIGERKEVSTTFNGTVRDYDMAVEPLYDANHNIVGVTCSALDITESKRLQRELVQAEVLKVQLQKQGQIVSLRENFVRSVSHEFRTPLSIILSSKELLERYGDRLSPESRQQHLQKIGDEVDYMVQMLEDVLVVSKARAIGLEIQTELVELETVCQEIIDEIKISYPQNEHIEFICPEKFTPLTLDKQLIHYMLGNLLSNAIKFSPPQKPVRLEVTRQETSLIFQVTDQGIGIPREEQEYIFEPFYRAKNNHKVKGTGLGLTLVQSSVEAYNGSIILDSTEGVGTTFTISLPVFLDQPQ
jgi:PAS domain S-box-containing protein